MEQTDLLRYALDTLERLAVPHMLVGSFASTIFGEPRFTHDIDIVLELPPAKIAEFCEAFEPPTFYLNEQAVRDAVKSAFQFNVLHTNSGNKIDFIIARGDAWGQNQMARRQKLKVLPDRVGSVARPEDVIVGKLIYYAEGGSEKHVRDIAGILRVSGDGVDREDIRQWAEKLGLSEIWQAVLQKITSSSNSATTPGTAPDNP